MKAKLFIMLVLMLMAGLASAATIGGADVTGTITLTLETQDGGGGSKQDADYELTTLNTWYSIGNPGSASVLVHIAVPGGIDDLHISVPAGQVDAIEVNQSMFPNQNVNGLTADMDGAHYPFCTYFRVESDVSFDIMPTPEPATVIFLALGSMVLLRQRA